MRKEEGSLPVDLPLDGLYPSSDQPLVLENVRQQVECQAAPVLLLSSQPSVPSSRSLEHLPPPQPSDETSQETQHLSLSVPALVRSLPARPNILPPLPPFLVLPLLLSAGRTQWRTDPLQSPAIRTLQPPASNLLSPLRPEPNLLPFPGPGPDTQQEGEEEDRQQDGGLHVGD